MIEVTNTPPEEIKGTKDGRNYHFFKQKAILRTVDRDGIEEVRSFTVVANPGETYEPGSDYAISADSCYLARDERGNDVLRLRRSVKLVRSGIASARPLKAAA
jgi:hypothetical protein